MDNMKEIRHIHMLTNYVYPNHALEVREKDDTGKRIRLIYGGSIRSRMIPLIQLFVRVRKKLGISI